MLINGSSSRLALLAIAALALVGCSKKENYGADTTGAASSTAMADTSRMAASTTYKAATSRPHSGSVSRRLSGIVGPET